MKTRETLFALGLCAGWAVPAFADCETKFLKVACSDSSAYTCKQKYRELKACKVAEAQTTRDAPALAVKKSEPNRQAVELIEKANRTVSKRPQESGAAESRAGGSLSTKPERPVGESF